MKYDVFISYSRKDTAIADQICAAFDKAGITYFIDRQGIGGGMEFPKVLAPAIKESEVFLLLASQNAYESHFTNREITFAFNKKRGEKMLPYIIDDADFPEELELIFASNNWRVMKTHPIEPILVDDVLQLLGKTRPVTKDPKTSQTVEQTEPTISIKENHIVTETTSNPKLRVVDRNQKYGFVDEQGKVAIPFEYDSVKKFSEGLACVAKNSQYGFIDNSGRVVIPFDYSWADSYSEGLAAVAKGRRRKIDIWTAKLKVRDADDEDQEKFGFIDKQGNTVIPFVYDSAGSFSEGLAPVAIYANKDNADNKDHKKFGFIDKKGNTIIPFEFDEAHSFSEGLSCVKKNNKYGFIDKQGKTIIPFEYYDACNFSEGLACVWGEAAHTHRDGLGFIDKNGRVIIPFEYRQAESFSEGLACVLGETAHTHRDGFGFVDKNGRVVIPFEYSDACSFSEGLACVSKRGTFDNKYGFIDKKGDIVIPFKYTKAGSFENGLAKVTKKSIFGKEQTFFIDRKGNRIDLHE